MKFICIPIFVLASAFLLLPQEDVNARGKITARKTAAAQFIFSSEPFKAGSIDSKKLKTEFNSNDKIYTLGFFPGKIGKFGRGEKLRIRLLIDGKVVFNGMYKNPPEAGQNQFQIYVRNTGEDDFNTALGRCFNYLKPGKHTATLICFRDKFVRYKRRGGKEPQYKEIELTRGKFIYIQN